MYIKEDYSYITKNERLLIERGYGKLTVHSIHFDRYFTEKEKENNFQISKVSTAEERSNYCDELSRKLSISMNDIIEKIAKKHTIYQFSEDVKYNTDWDLYFYSNEGWNEKNYMDYFRLSFNHKRSVKENMKLLKEIISIVNLMEYKNIYCRVQYDADIDKDKVEKEAKAICERVLGKFINLYGITGKIKLINEENGRKEYGFFKKNARTKYYEIPNIDLLAMNL